MNLPKVTFIICHHNYEQFLEDAIKSAKNQDYPNTHICFIDDCSYNQKRVDEIITNTLFVDQAETMTAESGYYIRHNSNYTAIFLEGTPNGPSKARNIGIQQTLEFSDFYAILDADDINYSNKITRMMQIALQSSEIGVVYADYHTLNVDNGERDIEYKEPFDIDRLHQECIVHSGALISKAALLSAQDQFGFYDETMRTCEDFDLWIRIARKFMFCHIAEPLSLVRVHSSNSTNSVNQEVWNRNWQRINDKNKVYYNR